MRFGIDISSIVYGTGVSRYTSNLVRSLVPLLHKDDQLTLVGTSLRHRRSLLDFAGGQNSGLIHARISPLPPQLTSILYQNLNLPLSFLAGDLDVFHVWDWYVPKPGHVHLVATIHDLALFKFPKYAHPQIKAHHLTAIKRLKQFQAQIIAVSSSTKTDLVELFQFDPQNITVIPESLPSESCLQPSPSHLKMLKNRYQLAKPYILIVGTLEPRKNHQKAIAAWQHFKSQFDLVIVGKEAWANLTPQKGVIFTGFLTGMDLAALYQGASLLLYPSLYEGFGLPILEGFFHRLPVVTSNLSSMPEVAGDAAVLVDPLSAEAIINGIQTALNQKDVLIQKGIQRLKYFSWSKTALQTLAVYRQLC